MAKYYIKPNAADALRLEEILTARYVTEDGENYKFPFDDKTLYYIFPDSGEWVYYIDERMSLAESDEAIALADRQFITTLYAAKKNESEAVAAGWIPDPNEG